MNKFRKFLPTLVILALLLGASILLRSVLNSTPAQAQVVTTKPPHQMPKGVSTISSKKVIPARAFSCSPTFRSIKSSN